MDDEIILSELKEIFEKLGVEIREQALDYEAAKARSGLARVHQKKVMFLDQELKAKEKIGVLIEGLRGFDLETVYISPYLRAQIEKKK